jgi:hypothetical protein
MTNNKIVLTKIILTTNKQRNEEKGKENLRFNIDWTLSRNRESLHKTHNHFVI